MSRRWNRQRVVHLERAGERAKDGPVRTFGPYAGEPDWQAGTVCGERVSTFVVTRRLAGVTCPTCLGAPTTAEPEEPAP